MGLGDCGVGVMARASGRTRLTADIVCMSVSEVGSLVSEGVFDFFVDFKCGSVVKFTV